MSLFQWHFSRRAHSHGQLLLSVKKSTDVLLCQRGFCRSWLSRSFPADVYATTATILKRMRVFVCFPLQQELAQRDAKGIFRVEVGQLCAHG